MTKEGKLNRLVILSSPCAWRRGVSKDADRAPPA